jgi:hemoglobin-like flavoprotein
MSTVDKVQYLYKYNINENDSFPILTIVYIVVFLIIILIYYARTVISQYNLEWKSIRCNPKHIFYSGFLEPNNLDPFTATYENLKNCITAETGLETPKITNIFKILDNSHTNNIDTLNKVKEYTNIIPENTQRILENIDSSYNKLNNVIEENEIKMTLLFYYQTKIYNAIRLYIERIYKIMDLLTNYSLDMLKYSLSKDKLNLKLSIYDPNNPFAEPIQLDNFIIKILTDYNNILIEDGTEITKRSYEQLYETYHMNKSNTNYNYSELYNQAEYLKDRIIGLKNIINNFKTDNQPKIANINKKCRILNINFNESYRNIFPQLTLNI